MLMSAEVPIAHRGSALRLSTLERTEDPGTPVSTGEGPEHAGCGC